jgi:2-oxoglutarate ferredoxin oxidoreductase subunit alpha
LKEEGVEVSYAHFDYINPLPANTEEVFSHFGKILVCELNSGQFAAYLRGIYPQFEYVKFGKVQGQPFLVSEIKDAIKKEI